MKEKLNGFKVIPYHKIHEQTLRSYTDFPFPDTNSPLILSSGTIIDSNNNVVGAGFLKLIGEAIVIINPKLDKRTIGHALDEIYLTGYMKAEENGLDGIHAFIYDNEQFVRVLKHRYNFIDCGHALSKPFPNKKGS